MNQYEAMFLFDPTFGGSLENCEAEIRRIMDRAEGEIVFCRKWDERRLAYRINGRKRGVYMLVYFKALADKTAGLERDVKLSENILRVLVLRADGMTLERMEQAVASQTSTESGGRTEGAPAAAPTGENSSAPSEKREAGGVASVAGADVAGAADESAAPGATSD